MSDAPAKQHESQTENKLLHQKCEGHGALVKSFWMDRVVGMNSCLAWGQERLGEELETARKVKSLQFCYWGGRKMG